MTDINLKESNVNQLVDRVAILAAEHDDCLLDNNIASANRIFDRIAEVVAELKSRPGDQRKALMVLYDHSNMHVRLFAAKYTLAVAPQAARQKLEEIKESGWLPDAGDAGMCLLNLDRGIFKPT
jgi:hypothetical protein